MTVEANRQVWLKLTCVISMMLVIPSPKWLVVGRFETLNSSPYISSSRRYEAIVIEHGHRILA